MKHIKQIIVFLIFLALISNPLLSQDRRTLDTKLADLLVQMPANNQ
jgi:hypothetical protein